MDIKGKNVLVVGSSPCVDRDLLHAKNYDLLVFVNGSSAAFHMLKPDITVINGYTVSKSSDVASHSMAAIAGKSLGHVICLTRGMNCLDMLVKLIMNDSLFGSYSEFDQSLRIQITEKFLGRKLLIKDSNDTPSTGLSAILLMMHLGAKNVSFTGFSTSGGHSYISGNTPRGHAGIDGEILKKLGQKSLLDSIKCLVLKLIN